MTVPPSVAPLPEGEPPMSVVEPHALLEGHLDFYRATLLRKLRDLPEAELRSARLPSGWTPLELVRHLTHVERRWLRWGFRAEQVPEPWGDEGPDERWRVPAGMTSEEVVEEFLAETDRSRKITGAAALDDRSLTGGRFVEKGPGGEKPPVPTLSWILFHLLQEYARHVGHLDVVVELATSETGE